MKQTFEEFRALHSLPDLRIWLPLEEPVTAPGVRMAMSEALAAYADLLISWLYPEGTVGVAEATQFTEADQDRIQLLLNKIMLLVKDCTLAELESTPADDVLLIKRLAGEWPSIVRELREYVIISKGAYSGEKRSASNISYLG